MAAAPFTVVESIERQAAACEGAGSPLYEALLRGLAQDHRAGGPTARLLDGVSDRPVHDAVPLRYVATAHRLALDGRAPALAARYPSCGGAWTPGDGGDVLVDAFLGAVAEHEDEFVAGLRQNVQTNEVGRAAVLVAGFSWWHRRTRLPLRTLEIGASAGLLSRWPSYRYDTAATTAGEARSELAFGPAWWQAPPPELCADLPVAERRASDVSPIDATTDSGRLRMLGFLWPDQLDRFARMRAALEVARRDPVQVERADAGAWLAAHLGDGLPAGAATVVFHSIVWQYLPGPTRDGVRAALATAGAGADADRPLCWLRMEPATPAHADLRATVWPGGEEHHLADVGYHGADVRWRG